MKVEKATTEHILYVLVLLLAAGLRFIGLGSLPLSDSEALWANQALELARGGHLLLGGQPGYILLTAAAFFLFGSSEFLARFWPALLGTVLVLAPYLYRERLGRSAALVMALALAIEPVLVAASRQADGRILAVAGLAFAAGFSLKGWLPGAGMGIGIAVLGGPSAWNALLAIALGCGVLRRIVPPVGATHAERSPLQTSPGWRAVLPWGVGTVIVLGALFGFFPGGWSALMNSLVSYAGGWTAASAGASLGVMGIGWTLLSPLSILFGLSGLFRAWLRHEPADRALGWVWLALFGLVMLYPQRQTVDLAYAVVPLLALGARQALRVIPILREGPQPFAGGTAVYVYALLVAVLGVSIWMNSQGFANVSTQDAALRIGGVAGACFLLVASLLLVGWGWDWQMVSVGFCSGVSAVLLVFTLATAWSSAGMSNRPGAELWVNGPYPTAQTLALKVLGDVSEWRTGHRDGVDLLVSGVDAPSLRWALRNFRNVKFVSALAPDTKASVILLPGNVDPIPERQAANLGLALPYTGQALEWGQKVLWPELLPQDWLGWFFYRDLANRPDIINRQMLLLWLRSDLFPGALKTGAAR